MQDDPKEAELRGLAQGAAVSDLIGVKLTLGLTLWFLWAVLAAGIPRGLYLLSRRLC